MRRVIESKYNGCSKFFIFEFRMIVVRLFHIKMVNDGRQISTSLNLCNFLNNPRTIDEEVLCIYERSMLINCSLDKTSDQSKND